MSILSIIGKLFGGGEKDNDPIPSSLGSNCNSPKKDINLGNTITDEQKNEESDVVNNEKEVNEMVMPEDNVSEDKKENEKTEDATACTYNLIILDESGSMSHVRRQTISGCNETLNSIRNTAKEHSNIKQYVSIFCFDTSNSRYIFHDVPVENTRDLVMEDYCPNDCTPLYDAVGYTVSQLSKVTKDSDSVGMVTIITDGLENASRRWTQKAVIELIESLKKKGWVFTFIGANIDVEGTARGLGIDSYMEFEQTDLGMSEMFEQERRSHRAYSEKRRYMRGMLNFAALSCEEREEAMGALNHNYFVERERIAPDVITKLNENEIFVFGSNIYGHHNGGASLFALEQFGAVNGQAEGIQGMSYAIPTDGNTFDELKEAVERFTDYVVMHPKQKFMLTAIGCGTAGYGVRQIAPLFRQAYSFGNVYVPAQFLSFMEKNPNI